MFDPWTAKYEDVFDGKKGLVEELLSEDFTNPANLFSQWIAASHIKRYEQIKSKMSGYDVLACIRECLNHDLVAPEWLAKEFIRRYDAVLNCRAKSWDDPKAFGKPYKKGTNIAAQRKRRNLKWGVYSRVIALAKDSPIDEALFAIVGKEFNIGKTLASEYYYSAKEQSQSILAK